MKHLKMSAVKQWCDDMLPGYNVLCSIVTRKLYNTAVILVIKNMLANLF